MIHDKFCPYEDPKYCQCEAIAKVRADEREQIIEQKIALTKDVLEKLQSGEQE